MADLRTGKTFLKEKDIKSSQTASDDKAGVWKTVCGGQSFWKSSLGPIAFHFAAFNKLQHAHGQSLKKKCI